MARNSTKYKPLDLNPIVYREKSRPLCNAELLLRDAHAMLFLPRNDVAALQSGCNYAMLITLCCVLGGISRTIYPRSVPHPNGDRACFSKLFGRIPWESDKQGWIPRETAADILYDGFRSPLVHELGTDEGGKSGKRSLLHDKYVVGKRGLIPAKLPLAEIINCDRWEPEWAVMHYKGADRKKVKISLVGLYIHTRKLIEQLSYDEELIKKGVFPLRT